MVWQEQSEKMNSLETFFMKKNRNEFEIISDFFSPLARDKGSFGPSDDVAVLSKAKGYHFIVSTDMLISEVHFFSNDDPEDIFFTIKSPVAKDYKERRYLFFKFKSGEHGFIEDKRKSWSSK